METSDQLHAQAALTMEKKAGRGAIKWEAEGGPQIQFGRCG